jgi:hypothetical protein
MFYSGKEQGKVASERTATFYWGDRSNAAYRTSDSWLKNRFLQLARQD